MLGGAEGEGTHWAPVTAHAHHLVKVRGHTGRL
jgi:hypothetical protein